MGILDDTLLDASRPLPQLTLRRAAGDAVPEFAPEPADDPGEALTVYRLQKDGGGNPPVAPPAPRAVDAVSGAAGPLHAPVGKFDDATLQFVNSIEGLETGKGQASTRNSDATDRQERLVSPDPSHRLDYGASTGSSVFSNRVPSPSDDPGKFVHRIGSSDGMRRATGRGAPSGEPVTPSPDAALPANRGPGAFPPAAGQRAGEAAAAGAVDGFGVEASAGVSPPAAAAVGERRRQAAPLAAPPAPAAAARPAAVPAAAPRMQAASPPAAPRLSIGRIEVTVLAAPQPAPKPAPAPSDAFLSKHYLRRL